MDGLQAENDHERMLLMQKDINYIKDKIESLEENQKRDMQTILIEIKQTRNKCPGEQCVVHGQELDEQDTRIDGIENRLSLMEERWKILIGIISLFLFVGVPVITWLMDKVLH